MLKNTFCSICLSINKRTINIYKTDLQYAYETLANFKVLDYNSTDFIQYTIPLFIHETHSAKFSSTHSDIGESLRSHFKEKEEIRQDECWMCYICHTRLRQCHQLQQLAVQTRGLIDDIFQNKIESYGAIDTILELSTSETKIISITFPCSYIKQESEGETGAYNDDGIEQDEILENTDDFEVKKEPSIDFEDDLVGITQELSNVDNIDAHQKAKVPELIIVKRNQSVIDKYVRQSPTTHAVTEIYPEDRGEKIFVEQGMEQREIKQEIKDKGIEQDDEQDDTNDCEGRDHAGEAQAGCYRGPLSCDVCLRNLECKSKLIKHMRTHTGERPFSCNVCLKKFTQKSSLNQHMLIHTGEKPFSCDICSKKFTQKIHLINHIVIHTGEKPFSCDICLKKCSRSDDLKKHQRTHSSEKPYSCVICLKKFTFKSSLNQHIRIHTGEKPFSCDICLKKFTCKSNLNRHILTHAGEKPFSCDIGHV